jgi:hypothetical protein
LGWTDWYMQLNRVSGPRSWVRIVARALIKIITAPLQFLHMRPGGACTWGGVLSISELSTFPFPYRFKLLDWTACNSILRRWGQILYHQKELLKNMNISKSSIQTRVGIYATKRNPSIWDKRVRVSHICKTL